MLQLRTRLHLFKHFLTKTNCVLLPAAYVSCHWRQRQAGRLFAYNLAGSTASSGRAKTSVARRLVVSRCVHPCVCNFVSPLPDLPLATASLSHALLSTTKCLQAAQSGELLAAVDRHTAMVWRMDRFPQNPLVLTHTKMLTCAALT